METSGDVFQEHFLVKLRTPPVAALDRMQSAGQKSQSQSLKSHQSELGWVGMSMKTSCLLLGLLTTEYSATPEWVCLDPLLNLCLCLGL